ncbi:sugar O-acetyltransferase [Nocardioides sp. GY 10113]|uniref:sugar O-acetyltransferase n=1 Tax=Nocardioides sp. GY 10113 TaxID=2569761 RepID=UPI0010A8D2FC|nr:sugar O-acetyltransferase [Nocardioides sp. GY 10113]TIC88860.1 sugar O-acetyltransferase [Nocardioides sp. GY 10113]
MADQRSMRERMLAGDLYRAEGPEIVADLARAQRLTHRINGADPTDRTTVRALFAELLGEYGADAEIRPPFHCDYGHQIRFGARSFANFGLVVLDVARVVIGEDVQIGPNVQLLTATHPVEPQPRREKWESALPITIGDNVWLGGGTIVCPGVTIGADTVVGAGSVVTRSLPPRVVAVGSPARVVREI